jgi:glycosyltransferase 2 family protein
LKKKHLGAVLGIAAGLAAIGFVYYRYRTSGFKIQEFAAALGGIDWVWMGAAMVLVLSTYVGRAVRWQIMLRPLNPDSRLSRIFIATCIGFTAVVLFGRAGEPVRPYLIAKNENVSFSSQIAAWLVERILDLLMVLVIFGIALTQVHSSSIEPGPKFEVILEAGGYAAGVTGLLCLALLFGLHQFRGQVQERIMGGLSFLPDQVHLRIAKFLGAFEEGMQSTRRQTTVWLLVTYTVVEWALITGAFLCIFRAFPATHHFRLNDSVIALGFIAFGSIVQLPGVGGGMQIVATLVLTQFYGLTLETASGIALVMWMVTFVSIVPGGLVLAFREGIKFRNLRQITSSGYDL